MLKSTQVLFLTLLIALTLAITPVLFAQETAQPDNTTRNQIIFGGAVLIIMYIYWRRRKNRLNKNK